MSWAEERAKYWERGYYEKRGDHDLYCWFPKRDEATNAARAADMKRGIMWASEVFVCEKCDKSWLYMSRYDAPKYLCGFDDQGAYI